jgi:hypothetical protein
MVLTLNLRILRKKEEGRRKKEEGRRKLTVDS